MHLAKACGCADCLCRMDPREEKTFAVAMSAGRLADAEKKQGDLEHARQHLGEVIELLRPLAAENAFSVKYSLGIEMADQRLGLTLFDMVRA